MRPLARILATVLLAGFSYACWGSAPAAAEIAYTPCAETNDFGCGHVTVPLDPSGALGGTLTIALRRHRAPVGEAHSAIIALAGGPGQPALPFSELFAELLGPLASTRDLVVFDQRGVGLSGPLSCHAFERPDLFRSPGALIEACSAQLGPTRSLYTTADTVADIEAIRRAGGYEKLVLYGTSYGTKVAEEYAETYPSHVEGLVLDSVVTPEGPEPLDRPTFAAIPRVLRQLCRDGACAGITRNPVADLARLVRRMAGRGLSGRYIDGGGRSHRVPIAADDLLEILLAGDFVPELRAEFVTAVRAATAGDTAPLARLLVTASSGEGEQEDFDMPLFYATSCEEQAFPWNRALSPRARIGQVLAAASALPASAFAPFTARDALTLSDAGACAYWPSQGAAPAVEHAPLPDVPTLILSGADDLRTPTSGAREVAAQIPDAKLLVVPYTGHSVLTAEATSCGRTALEEMFSKAPLRPCAASASPASLRPPPLPPERLAGISPARGYGGLPGRTLNAVGLTLADLLRSLDLQLALAGDSSEGLVVIPTLRTGGLRAGWAEFAGGGLSLHGYSYVPGVTISGSLASNGVELRITGASAASGVLREGRGGSLVGSLGGSPVNMRLNSDPGAAIVGEDAATGPHSRSGGSAVHAGARELAGLLGRIAP